MRRAGVKRLLVVGGAGSLEGAPGKSLMETDGFPEAFKAEAKAGPRFLKRDFRQSVIAIGPSLLLPQTGERTGRELLEFAWMTIRRLSVAPTALLQ